MRFGAVEFVMVAIGVLCLVTVATARDHSKEAYLAALHAARKFEMRMPYRQ